MGDRAFIDCQRVHRDDLHMLYGIRSWLRRLARGLIALFVFASAAAVARDAPAPGTVRMAERLREWNRQYGDRHPYANSSVIRDYEARMPTAPPQARIQMQYRVAEEWLNMGHPEFSLAAITNLQRLATASRISLSPQVRRSMDLLHGLAYLRLGEFENCLQHHNPDSCLMPIRGGGQHQERRGAQNAEAIFARLVRQRPTDLGARWLLNLAAMTLGHYPDGVTASARLPESIFESEYPLARFPEIAAKVGLAVDDLSGGTVAEDFDGDGLLDVLLTSWSTTNQCRYFKNRGDGTFEDRTVAAGLLGVTGGLNAMQTDYNNDGWPDVYIVRGAWLGEMGLLPDSLLRNNGDGSFADVTEEVGLLSFHPALSAVWFDANNDGWLDLFVGNETADRAHPHPCQLFLNDRGARFREVAAAAGVAVVSFVRGVTAGDFDNDGWPDLYLSCLGGTNLLFRNQGAALRDKSGAAFGLAAASAQVQEPFLSFPTWFWDYDNDGWLDIFVCGYGASGDAFSPGVNIGHATLHEMVADRLGQPTKAERPRLFRNNRDGSFSDHTGSLRLNRAILAMSGNFGDLDNDGWLDFYLGTGSPYFGSLVPNEMFRNDGGRQFQNVTTAGGFGHLQKGHGIAFADLNNDGQQDVVLNVGGAYPGDNYYDALFANPGHPHHWLGLRLKGRESNRAAIGARIKVVASTAGQTREVHRVVGSGGSFGASTLRQEIGLGGADRIERVEVWWPVTGVTNILTGLERNRFYEFTEGDGKAVEIPTRRFSWPVGAVGAGRRP
ncbi:MAG TPA: CRTAC1 family protein [Methylomirabilota bacterium]|nr:CRTAC1 family protein [Methylomirabilota bacterium]